MGNRFDQRLQSVLYIMGESLGKHGIDGERGPDTMAAVRKGAKAIGANGSTEDMRQAIVDKLKDPVFRDVALEKLKQMPQNKETTIAMQTVLAAAGHDTLYMRDPATGMMNGKMNAATKLALENTEDGKPNARAYAALGIPESATQLAMNGGGGKLNGEFQMAVAATTPAQNTPQSAPAIQQPVKVASLDRTN